MQKENSLGTLPPGDHEMFPNCESGTEWVVVPALVELSVCACTLGGSVMW